jgi:hypothetical protein
MLGGGCTVRPLVAWRSAVMLSLSRWRSGNHRSLAAAGGRAVRMGGTAGAAPRPRAVAVGLAVAPTTTIPLVPVAARIRIPRSTAFYGAGLVSGAGALWVDAGDRTVRVDARTGRVAGSARVPVQAAASDGLWSCTAAREGGPGRLVRMDPRTLAESARIRLPGCPAALVAERGVVWALDDSGRQLLRVQATSGRVTRIGLPVAAFNFVPDEAGFGTQLAMGEGAVWVVSDQIETPTRLGARVGRGVVRIDPRTARVTAVTPLDNLEPAWMALAVGAGGVWVGGAQARRAGPGPSMVVDRIDPRSGRLVGAFTLARNTEGLLAAGHGSLWLATFGGRELLRLDPSRR